MAQKQRPSHRDDPPAVSSSNEEEEEETFSDDDEEEEEEAAGGEEEEGGEQSSSEEEEPSTPPRKPSSSSSGSKAKPREPESTPVKATHARSTRSSIMKKKRPNSERDATPSKRVKKKDPDPEPKSQGGAEEKKLFQRLWSDDNEIELLKGMLDYRAIHDSDPAANGAAFYEFVKKSLHVEVTKAQLVDKMKRLRKKYSNNAGRGKKGKDPTFSKPHERKTYELSKKIWGCAAADGVSGKCLNRILSFNKNVVLEERLIKKGLELIGQQKRLELEERWKRVELAELQMYVTQAELIRDQASLILEAYKGQV
ncbi:probable transcription factor At4g00390 isoform X2 [Quercus suber]|uniref:probable transcription factor At4g00390 isoform X2 n=1 Tax=Quercus suber TaxID=58331 RepID=UPI000CE1A4D6|nr:probable transcription factor At4g00390 isoform X2 [Quercus suber]POF10292.1 putative transcription factor [Quercus suber]